MKAIYFRKPPPREVEYVRYAAPDCNARIVRRPGSDLCAEHEWRAFRANTAKLARRGR